MSEHFFEKPILNSPYEYPARHWELDDDGQPTDRIIERRRTAQFITPVPKPKKRKRSKAKDQQLPLVLDEGHGLSTAEQQYDPISNINGVRQQVDRWRMIPDPDQWRVTPETARLLQHWRHHKFQSIRPFFCQLEAVETAIWLTEVAPKIGKVGQDFLDHIKGANEEANPALYRTALKLATGAGKTTVMAMLIAWQTVNAVRHPTSRRFTRGFLIVAPGITIRDRLQVLQPNDTNSYYASRELNDEGLFNVEYADILGIPFDFTAKPVIAPPSPPRDVVRVNAVNPDRERLEIHFPRVDGYRVDLPDERLTATFSDDSVLELTPDLVGPSITHNQGIVGEEVVLTVEHLEDTRRSTILMNLTKHLIYHISRNPDEEPKIYLFGQMKRIARQWMDGYLKCSGGTHVAQLLYREIADMAGERIKAAISASYEGGQPIKAILDAYNPTGSSTHVGFFSSKETRWKTDLRRSHINWVICDSDWEAEFCRVAEAHPNVRSYVKNQGLGLEVPYKDGSTLRKYLPDFIVQIDDGQMVDGQSDPLNLVVEVKGYRGENAKDKANTMKSQWIPGVNNLGTYGRWAFAEFTAVYEMEAEFDKLVKSFVGRYDNGSKNV